MKDLFGELIDIAARIRNGKSGVDFLVVIDDSLGYESTPLEMELTRSCDALEKELGAAPEMLTGENLAKLLKAMAAVAPAADSYRARMQSVAGDYDDADSPAKLAGENLTQLIVKTVRALETKGMYPLADIDEETLLMTVSFDNAGRYAGTPVFKHLFFHLGDASKTFKKPVFKKLFKADHAVISKKAAALNAPGEKGREWILRELNSMVFECDREGRKLILKAVEPVLKCEDERLAGIAGEIISFITRKDG